MQALFYFWVMRKMLFILAVILFAGQARSQTIALGVKAGINSSSLSTKISNYGTTDNTVGFVGGAYFRVGILGFIAQPEILYSQRKGVFSVNGKSVKNTLNYVDIPVLVGYKFLVFRVNAGPNFQFLVGTNQDAEQSVKDPNFAKSRFNSSAVGFQAGIGVDVSKISIDVRYDGCIGDLGKKYIDENGVETNYSTRASMWQFTLGYKLF